MDLFFIFGAKYLFILSLIIGVIFFFKSEPEIKKKILVFTLIVLPLAFIISVAAREIYFNPRPFVVGGFEPLIPHEPDNGFPSDHALLVAAVAAIVSVFDKKYSLWLWIIAIVVSLSRVYAGVHHFTDVLGSFAIAIGAAWAAYATIGIWRRKQTNS